jgi:dUTP pyrophosphatase
MKVKIKKLSDNAITPTYGTSGAACFDIYNADLLVCNVWNDSPQVFRTGLSFEIPENHVMLVFSRSGHGFKNDVRLSNCVGVIDSDYRGELMVKLSSDSDSDVSFTVFPNDRIAQAMIIPFEQVQFEVSDDLSETDRGTGGLGSTGK